MYERSGAKNKCIHKHLRVRIERECVGVHAVCGCLCERGWLVCGVEHTRVSIRICRRNACFLSGPKFSFLLKSISMPTACYTHWIKNQPVIPAGLSSNRFPAHLRTQEPFENLVIFNVREFKTTKSLTSQPWCTFKSNLLSTERGV